MASILVRAIWSEISNTLRHNLSRKQNDVLQFYNSYGKRQLYCGDSINNAITKHTPNSVSCKRYYHQSHQIQGPIKDKSGRAYRNASRQDSRPPRSSGIAICSTVEPSRLASPIVQRRRLETISRPAAPFLPPYLSPLDRTAAVPELELPTFLPTPPPTPTPTLTPTPIPVAYSYLVNHEFKYYHAYKSTFEINLAVQQKLLAPLRDFERKAGSLYAFHLPGGHAVNGGSNQGYVKIGRSVEPEQRMKAIRRKCGYQPRLAAAPRRMPGYARLERVLHLLLANYRMHEASGCPGCAERTRHREWFEVEAGEAAARIGAWQRWAAREPYEEAGGWRLAPRWRHRVESVDLTDPRCWEELLEEGGGRGWGGIGNIYLT